jgi:hypothetical protein
MSTRKSATARPSAEGPTHVPGPRLEDAKARVSESLGQVNARAKAVFEEVGRRIEPVASRWPDLPQRGLKDAERAVDLSFDLASAALERQRALAKRLLAEAGAATERLTRR